MTSPLVRAFPGTGSLPSAGIAVLPTPVEQFPELAEEIGIARLMVKRDDLTSPVYGGNKVRKLEYLLGEALAEGRKAVITYGAYGSNHALATAVHARALGLEPHAVLSPQAPGPFASATLRAHAGLGTVLYPVDGWDGAREAVRAKLLLAERDGIAPYEIPMGGSNALGAIGYVDAAIEVVDQLRAINADIDGADISAYWRPDFVYLPLGTMSTAIGLAIGMAAVGAHTRVVGVRVTPEAVASEAKLIEMIEEAVKRLRELDPTFPDLGYGDLTFSMRDDWFEPGYGVVTRETEEAVSIAAALGLKLETTYTGKAFAALVDDARDGILAGKQVMFWDTYNSAPMPSAGPTGALPDVLQAYVAQCDQAFPSSTEGTE